MKRFFAKLGRFLWSWLFLKIILWGVGLLTLLIFLIYAEEDWRGARDWAAYQKELQAKGESLDLRQLAPPGKPENDLSKVPIFAELYQQPLPRYEGMIRQDKPKPTRLDRIDPFLQAVVYYDSKIYPKRGNYLTGQSLDISSYQRLYRSLPQAHLPKEIGSPAEDVLHALSQFDPEMKEVETAVNNPQTYWPCNYNQPFDGTTSRGALSVYKVAQILPLRAVAHLENHEADLAEKDYLFSFRLNDTLTKNCFLINYLIMAAVRHLDDAILWEGIHRHAWNNAQLQEMESALAATDMLALVSDSFRIERTSMIQLAKLAQTRSFNIIKVSATTDLYYNLGLNYLPISLLRPSGWWNEDRVTYCKGVQTHIEAINLSQGTVSSTAFPYHSMSNWEGNRADDTSTRSELYVPISSISLPFFDNMGSEIAKAETYRRLARLACRLEEYYLLHKQYPEKLEELPDLPPHLNQEVLSASPFHYQRKGAGYQLYSVGWDEEDDGGALRKRVFQKESGEMREVDADWPWPTP